MNNSDDSQKLCGDILRAELEAYRKLETWGASLFFGAIGLLAKQLIDWDQTADATKRVLLHPSAFMVPALVGLAAFVFLRIVNYRNRDVSERLFALADRDSSNRKRAFGWLGWSLAVMPLALGFGVSWFLTTGKPGRDDSMIPVYWIGVGIVIIALLIHLRRLCLFRTQAAAAVEMKNETPSSNAA